jgi:hypothetical protein
VEDARADVDEYYIYFMNSVVRYFIEAQNNDDIEGEGSFDQGWFDTYGWYWNDPEEITLEETMFTTPFVIESLNIVEEIEDAEGNPLVEETKSQSYSDMIDYSVDHFWNNVEQVDMDDPPNGHEEHEYGVYNFFGDETHSGIGSPGQGSVDIKNDIDDTAVIHVALRNNDDYYPDKNPNEEVTIYWDDLLKYFRDNMRAPSGGFFTWFTEPQEPTDMCMGTNANVVLDFLNYESYSIEIPKSMEWLGNRLQEVSEKGVFGEANEYLLYYRSPLAHLYFAAKAFYHYTDYEDTQTECRYIYDYMFNTNSIDTAPVQESSGRWLAWMDWSPAQNANQREDGYAGNVLETAFATNALLYIKKNTEFYNSLTAEEEEQLDAAIASGIDFIIEDANIEDQGDQDPDNDQIWWGKYDPSNTFLPRETFYMGGVELTLDMGSDEATTSTALEAIALYVTV